MNEIVPTKRKKYNWIQCKPTYLKNGKKRILFCIDLAKLVLLANIWFFRAAKVSFAYHTIYERKSPMMDAKLTWSMLDILCK